MSRWRKRKKLCRTPSPLASSGFGKPAPRQVAIGKNGRIPILLRVVKSLIVTKNPLTCRVLEDCRVYTLGEGYVSEDTDKNKKSLKLIYKRFIKSLRGFKMGLLGLFLFWGHPPLDKFCAACITSADNLLPVRA